MRPAAWQGLIDAARQSSRTASVDHRFIEFVGSGVNGRPAWTALAIEGNFSTVALDVHLEDCGVVHQTIDGCQRHCLIREDSPPFAKWLIGRDQQRASFVAAGDKLEQHTGFRLILAHICDVVEDQEVIAVEFGDRGLQRQLAPCDLSRCTRSVVRTKRTRQPFSTRARPIAAPR